MNNKVFYQHPNLMRALGMHETVMEVMVNVLGGGGDSKVTVGMLLISLFEGVLESELAQHIPFFFCTFSLQEIRFPQMVTNCCRFLCYFCRISRQNQRSMFDHLSYLLQNSGIGLGQCWPPVCSFCCGNFSSDFILKLDTSVYFEYSEAGFDVNINNIN